MEATLGDGRKIDLLRDGAPVSYFKPELVSAQFRNQRWRRWYQNMWKRYNPRHVPHFLGWEVRRWNAKHPQEEQILEARLIFVEEMTQLPGIPVTLKSYVLGTFPAVPPTQSATNL
jgi:hypothetical protein